MKKIFGFVILLGFALMLGAAGSADFAEMSFVNVLALELLGMVVVLGGTSGLLHYKKYVRRMMKKRRVKYGVRCSERKSGINIRMPEKELC